MNHDHLRMGGLSIVAASLFLAAPGSQSHAAEPYSLEFDKGTIIVELAEMEVPYSLRIETDQDCLAQVKKETSSSGTIFTHTGEACPKGSRFFLKLKRGLEARIRLQGGVVEVRNTGHFMSNYRTISAAVNGGVINTEVAGFSGRTSYAPAVKKYVNPKGSDLSDLEISVTGGVVNFMK